MNAAVVNLKAERLNRGLRQIDLAELLHVDRDTVRRIEAGSRPSAPTAKAYADWLDCKVTDIWPVDEVPVETQSEAEQDEA